MQFMKTYDPSAKCFKTQIITALLITKPQCTWYTENQTNPITAQTLSGSDSMQPC